MSANAARILSEKPGIWRLLALVAAACKSFRVFAALAMELVAAIAE